MMLALKCEDRNKINEGIHEVPSSRTFRESRIPVFHKSRAAYCTCLKNGFI
jgi:hypothetical protein